MPVNGVLEYLWFRDNDPWWATLLTGRHAHCPRGTVRIQRHAQSAVGQQGATDTVQQSRPLPPGCLRPPGLYDPRPR